MRQEDGPLCTVGPYRRDSSIDAGVALRVYTEQRSYGYVGLLRHYEPRKPVATK